MSSVANANNKQAYVLVDREILDHYYYNRFTALCPGLPGWAGTRRNIHPLTYPDHCPTFVSFSIYYDPQHPPCSIYVLDNLFAQPLSK